MALSPSQSFLTVVLSATAVICLAEAGLRRAAPLPPPLWEAEDGLADYARGDPDTVLFGSSHARSFVSLRAALDAPSGGAHQTAVVPLEWGTMTTYEWAMRNRLAPLMDEEDHGQPRRRRLSRAVFVTELYDLCHHEVEIANLPARAWSFRHFADDAARSGITDYNRNYVTTRFLRLFPGSVLVQERGQPRLVEAVKDLLRPPDPALLREAQAGRLRAVLTEMYPRCNDGREKEAFEAVLREPLRRRLEVTVVIFPMLREVVPPGLVPEAGGPPGVYSAYVADLARRLPSLRPQGEASLPSLRPQGEASLPSLRPQGEASLPSLRPQGEASRRESGRRESGLPVRVVDLTRRAPVTADDFLPDLEHLSGPGGQRLVQWALGHDLAFLRDPLPPPPPERAAGEHR